MRIDGWASTYFEAAKNKNTKIKINIPARTPSSSHISRPHHQNRGGVEDPGGGSIKPVGVKEVRILGQKNWQKRHGHEIGHKRVCQTDLMEGWPVILFGGKVGRSEGRARDHPHATGTPMGSSRCLWGRGTRGWSAGRRRGAPGAGDGGHC